MALLDHCPAPGLPLRTRTAQRHVQYVMLYSDIFYFNDSLAQPSLNADYLPVVFCHGTWIYKNTNRLPEVSIRLGYAKKLHTLRLGHQRLNHPNRITCHKAGLDRQPPQPVTPLTATPGKAASTAVSGIVSEKLDTSLVFNTSS